MKRVSSKERIIYLDILRIFSVFAMMMLHIAANNWNTTPVTTFEWQVMNAYDSLVRFCVPVFIMISGVFFLDEKREYTIKKLFTKNILRIFTAYIFWSACYAVYNAAVSQRWILKDILKQTILGQYHMWFLPMLVGLYLIIPFLRKITESKLLTEYFLILSIIFNFLVNLLRLNPTINKYMSPVLSDANIFFVLGYSSYFVLGFYLFQYKLTPWLKRTLYVLGAISVPFTIVTNSILSLNSQKPIGTFYGNLMPNTLFTSIAVFLFFQDFISKIQFGPKLTKTIYLFSKLTFGMYLVHVFINIACNSLGMSSLSFNPLFSIPLLTVLVFSVSLLITYFIYKIPVLNKYIL